MDPTLSCLKESLEGLAPLKEAVESEERYSEDERLTIFAPSDGAFQEVSSILLTLDHATLTHVRHSCPLRPADGPERRLNLNLHADTRAHVFATPNTEHLMALTGQLLKTVVFRHAI
jgi:hypothetical protein